MWYFTDRGARVDNKMVDQVQWRHRTRAFENRWMIHIPRFFLSHQMPSRLSEAWLIERCVRLVIPNATILPINPTVLRSSDAILFIFANVSFRAAFFFLTRCFAWGNRRFASAKTGTRYNNTRDQTSPKLYWFSLPLFYPSSQKMRMNLEKFAQ